MLFVAWPAWKLKPISSRNWNGWQKGTVWREKTAWCISPVCMTDTISTISVRKACTIRSVSWTCFEAECLRTTGLPVVPPPFWLKCWRKRIMTCVNWTDWKWLPPLLPTTVPMWTTPCRWFIKAVIWLSKDMTQNYVSTNWVTLMMKWNMDSLILSLRFILR